MSFLWSDPTPSNATSAVLSAPYKVDAANIGPLVNAILQFRESQNKAQQQSYSDMLSGISKGVSGGYNAYQQGQASGQADDAANAAIYGSQYPNDPYGGYNNPDVVPDYGGTSALKALQGERQLNPDAFMSDYKRMLMDSQIDSRDALTLQRLRGPGYKAMTPRQQITTANDAQGAAQDYFDQFGIPEDVINNPQAIHAPSDTPSVYRKGDPAVTVPKGQYLMVDPQTGEYIYRTPDDVESARAALDQYRQAQSQYRGALGIAGAMPPAPPGPAQGSAGVRQADINQAQQAMTQAPVQAPTQLAPGYGNKAVMMRAPDGTESPVDPALVDYYKKKGAVVVQ